MADRPHERTARDAKSRSRAAFDRQAHAYDGAGYGRHARRLHSDVMAAVAGFSFADILDVGCGTGATLAAVLETHPQAHARGIDISPNMVALARARLGNRARVDVADAERLPAGDASVDLVVCVDSFHHYPDPAAALTEMARVTRSGGGLVIGEWRVNRLVRPLMIQTTASDADTDLTECVPRGGRRCMGRRRGSGERRGTSRRAAPRHARGWGSEPRS